jgi:uncharacterized protein (DUF2267 family)
VNLAKLTLGAGAAVAGAVGLKKLLSPGTPGDRALRDARRELGRQLGHLSGELRGLSYRLAGRQPDVHVPDVVLADRVRSELGSLEKRLDLPRVHVMVDDHVVLLHGAVAAAHDAAAIEGAVGDVAGVRGVESHLHVGLLPGDTRPSEGATHPPSEARQRLLSGATSAGLDDELAESAVQATLGLLADRLPAGEREHLLGHLPQDARALVVIPRRTGEERRRVRTRDQFVGEVLHRTPELDPAKGEAVVESVMGVMRDLVPEESADIAAVLPADLRELWTSSVPAG